LKTYASEDIVVPRFCEANGFYTTPERSAQMKKIKSKNTKPELKLRKVLWQLGYRYRINVKKLPGSPDIVISKYKLAIFIDGEFWHGYNWEEKKKTIKTNKAFWIPKIERNIQRDQQNNDILMSQQWYVIRLWEHEIRNNFGHSLQIILNYINSFELKD
jgi:DNA mismatch endonuclease, patch repair protein